MLAYPTNDKYHRRLSRMATSIVLSLIFPWAFVGTIDGLSVQFGSNSDYVVYKMPKVPGRERDAQPEPLWIGAFPEEPPPVHASFLLFDFKQNLRRWPNVAGDISRSPPFFPAV